MINNKNILNHQRDSLSHISLFAYFDSFKLPTLESITENDFNLHEHHYYYDFMDFDKKIIPKPNEYVDYIWFLSKQYATDFICIAICHYIDCESFIALYTIGCDFKIIDEMRVLSMSGCEAELGDVDFRYQNYIINMDCGHDKYSSVYFENDSTFIVRSEGNYYYLKDTITKEVTVELSSETNEKYRIDHSGKFVIVENKGFTKEYDAFFWDYFLHKND